MRAALLWWLFDDFARVKGRTVAAPLMHPWQYVGAAITPITYGNA
jgi:hypothetical protein